MAFKKILAALDQSALGQSIYEQAVELAKTQNAELMLYHVLNPDLILGPMLLPGEMGLAPQLVTQAYEAQQTYLERQTQEVRNWLNGLCESAIAQGVSTQFSYRCTDAGRGICNLARDWGADLVLVGRRGRSGLTEAMLGSVSNYVMHHAPCAVLVLQTTPALSTAVQREVAQTELSKVAPLS
jgi:nucleotide-binding universal stress UspA family protein